MCTAKLNQLALPVNSNFGLFRNRIDFPGIRLTPCFLAEGVRLHAFDEKHVEPVASARLARPLGQSHAWREASIYFFKIAI